MRVLPVRYTNDIDALIGFYRALGLELNTASRGGAWADMTAAGGMLGLHVSTAAQPPRPTGACELSFEADERLEEILVRLHTAGYVDAHIIDEAFGRSLRVTDPDGVRVQVNESDPALYT